MTGNESLVFHSSMYGFLGEYLFSLILFLVSSVVFIYAMKQAFSKGFSTKFKATLWASGILAILTGTSFISGLYDASEINKFSRNPETGQVKFKASRASFPWGKIEQTKSIDRITFVELTQGTFGRLLGTGKVSMRTVTMANTEIIKGGWFIPCIENPQAVKAQIEAAFMTAHKGVKIQTD